MANLRCANLDVSKPDEKNPVLEVYFTIDRVFRVMVFVESTCVQLKRLFCVTTTTTKNKLQIIISLLRLNIGIISWETLRKRLMPASRLQRFRFNCLDGSLNIRILKLSGDLNIQPGLVILLLRNRLTNWKIFVYHVPRYLFGKTL